MNKESIAVGLDIGTTKIVAMVGKRNEYGKLEILGIGNAKSLGVKRGVVNNITQTIQSIQYAVAQASAEAGCKINDVVLGIAGQHIRSIHHQEYITRDKPDIVISELDIDKLIAQVQKLNMLPGEEIIHVLPQEFKVDEEGGIKEPIGMYGRRLEASFHVVVGQSASIRNAGRCVKDSGLELSGLTLEPLASADAVLSHEEKEAGVALIDIGGGTTDLAIFKDGIIRHTAVIPFGGNVITEDIKEGCSIIEKQAEQLKIRFGSAWPGENKDNEIVSIPGLRGQEAKEISLKNLSKIIHARVVEIIDMVFSEIKAYGYDNPRKKLIAGIVLTGGGSELKHIKQLVEYITGIDTRIGYPNEHISGESAKLVSRPLFATAVGLMMESDINNSRSRIYVQEHPGSVKIQAKTEPIGTPVENNSVPLKMNTITDKPQQKTEQPENNQDEQTDVEQGTSAYIENRFLGKFIKKFKDFIDKAE
ncbi:cell division protein FtsA [Paenimyroides aquimaris]|uniref:Cell division protein FtsA n=1 Tax=Paenimyroides marinum TaxID=1159016 RepID=A0A1H6LN70_9FLAO|nr:cell division protein FtsA [Paenimyroides aquimaris]SEH86337.1 cell division protein FtsA [Paenimyroides aquimaris]